MGFLKGGNMSPAPQPAPPLVSTSPPTSPSAYLPQTLPLGQHLAGDPGT